MMYKISTKLWFVAILLFSVNLSAKNPTSKVQMQNLLKPEPISFIENKGQLADEKGQLLPDIKYYGQQGGVYVYMRANRLSFVFTKTTPIPETEDKTQKKLHLPDKFKKPTKANVEAARMDMDFLGSNPEPEIVAEEVNSAYSNYYLAHILEAGITHVGSYNKLTYLNIYPNIDLVLLSKEKGFEYEFLVHPGGHVSDIQIHWTGTNEILAAGDGGIHYTNSLGELNESRPTSYTPSGPVESKTVMNNNIITFKIDNFNNSEVLIIDPMLSWGTYFGGKISDGGESIATDNAGNIFIIGSTSSYTGIATSGSYKTLLNYYSDAFLAKFSTSGKLDWATYYGGSDAEMSDGAATDTAGNVIMTGWTWSTSGIATSGAFQTSYAGHTDHFLAKFNSSGIRLWATYNGGSDSEYCDNVATDAFGNVFISGMTVSTSGIASSGAYKTYLSGNEDAYLAKFTPSGTRAWATYYGGGNDDLARSLATDASGNVYMTGYTKSTSGIATTGAFQTSYASGANGTYDGFLAKFSASGVMSWATYFGGGDDDYSIGLATDSAGNVFITGGTASISGIATTGAYKKSHSGKNDAFLAKFNASGKRAWATYYGGGDDDWGYCLATNLSGNIFLAGHSSSNSGIAISGAYQSSYAGKYDAFLVKFSTSGARYWATYYGGTERDYVFGIANDPLENIFITGITASTSGIATSGAHQTSYAGYDDAFLAKFSFRISTPVNTANDTILCSGATIPIGKTAVTGHIYSWTSKPAGFTSTLANPSVSPTITTTYYLTESDSIGSGKDSVIISVDTACVWPGDANRDKIVNNNDLLNIGLGFGTVGHPRPAASLSWTAQYAPDWTDTFTNKVNYKHADCNGDSTITNADTLAIITNYSKTHLKTFSANQGMPTDPHLSLVFSKDSATAGDVVKADLMYGNSSIPASNIYGLAFSIIYPAGLVDTVLADYNSSWIAPNILSISKTAASGQLDMAVVRTDQKDTTGFGKLATLYFKLGTTLPNTYTKLNISIAENTQINAKGQYKPVYMQSDSILVKQTFTGLGNADKAGQLSVSLSPNPANAELLIRLSEQQAATLSLRDMTGKEVTIPQYVNGLEYKLNTSTLPTGIYMLNISTGNGMIMKKVVIQH